jgi:hypothetical protein
MTLIENETSFNFLQMLVKKKITDTILTYSQLNATYSERML